MIFNFESSNFRANMNIVTYKKNKISLLKKSNSNCIFLMNNKCQIYNRRPFNCKMFPFDIKKIDNKFYWIVWDFCYVPNSIEKYLKKLEKDLKKIDREEITIYIYIIYIPMQAI